MLGVLLGVVVIEDGPKAWVTSRGQTVLLGEQ
jgi:hypothetical protein